MWSETKIGSRNIHLNLATWIQFIANPRSILKFMARYFSNVSQHVDGFERYQLCVVSTFLFGLFYLICSFGFGCFKFVTIAGFFNDILIAVIAFGLNDSNFLMRPCSYKWRENITWIRSETYFLKCQHLTNYNHLYRLQRNFLW